MDQTYIDFTMIISIKHHNSCVFKLLTISSLLVILWMRLYFWLIFILFYYYFFFVLNKMGMGWSTVLPYQCMAIIASTLDEKQMFEGLKIGIKVASAFLDELSHSHWVWSEPSLKSIMSIDKTFVINLEKIGRAHVWTPVTS